MGKTARVLSSAAAHTAASIPAMQSRGGFGSTAARGFMKNEPEAMFGYATKITDAIDGLEKTIALAKSGFGMVSNSLPTKDSHVLASQLEADLVTAQREVIELSEMFPQARYFCAGSLGRLAKTTGDCRDYLTGLKEAWDPNVAQDKRKIAEDIGTLHRRLKKDIGKFRKDVQQVAKSQKDKISGDMQTMPAGFDNNQPRGGWGFGGPAAGQGWGQTPLPPQMQAPPRMAAPNAQRYGAPFGYGGDPSMMSGYPNGGGDWGMSGVGGAAANNFSLGPAAYGGAFGYNGGPVPTAQQGPMVPYMAGHHPNPNLGAAPMPFGHAAATPVFGPYAPQQKPALPPVAPMSGQLALAASPASPVQWDPEGRLRYFHPSHQSWYFCPMGSEQGQSYYFHPITQEKYFFPNTQGW